MDKLFEKKVSNNRFFKIRIVLRKINLRRYDHFAVLCELLPTGLPSMVLDVTAAANGYYNSSLQPAFLKSLDCVGSSQNMAAPLDFEADPYLFEKMSWCYFPGSQIFKVH